MAAAIAPHSLTLCSPNHKSPLRGRLRIPIIFSTPPILYRTPPVSFSGSRRCSNLTVKCAADESEQEGPVDAGSFLSEALSGMVDSRVEEILNREENRRLLEGLEKATQRVERAKTELSEIQKQEIKAKLMRDYINQLESRRSEIAECQREILKARAMVQEAEQYLSIGEDEEIDRNKERLESVKAASVSALIGTLAWLPISFTKLTDNFPLFLPLGVTFTSCMLFGVTYRYAVRRDLDNFQLKTGTAAAFGVVKGLATLDGGPPLESKAESFVSHAINGAVYVSENLLVFLFAAVALDLCFKRRLLSPFPIQGSAAETNES